MINNQATRSMLSRFCRETAWLAGPVVLCLVLTTLALFAIGADPLVTFKVMWQGAFGNIAKVSYVVDAWIPLTLTTAGLLVTFAAGLWNIGIEGQILMGAVFATWAARTLNLPSEILVPAVLVSGMVGGAFWALLAGILKTTGKVHEIFGGLGLNFIASGVALFLIMGPWKRAGIASTSGTEPFPAAALLPKLPGLSVGPLEIALSLAALLATHLILNRTLWGLKLKAIGSSPASARWLGIAVNRNTLGAFAWCGLMAGLAGAEQAIGVWGRLVPSISGGYGYLSILVVLLAGLRVPAIPFIAFFFSTVNKGSLALPIDLRLDSALGGVTQGTIALLFILSRSLRARLNSRRGVK